MRYPKIAVVLAVVSVLVGARSAGWAGPDSIQYGPGEESAQLIDFVIATGITFLFWYGVVLAVGWAYRRLTGGADVDET